jgi:hypothetical protein
MKCGSHQWRSQIDINRVKISIFKAWSNKSGSVFPPDGADADCTSRGVQVFTVESRRVKYKKQTSPVTISFA